MYCCFFCVGSDGKLDIVVPSFVHYLEVLEGTDGDKMPGEEIVECCCFLVTVGFVVCINDMMLLGLATCVRDKILDT